MTRLIESRPKRTLVVKETAPTRTKEKVLIITEHLFFAERDKDGGLPKVPITEQKFSIKCRDDVLEKFSNLVILEKSDESRQWLSTGFGEHLNKVTFCKIDPDSVMVSTKALIDLIRSKWTVRMSLPRNMRTVSYLNLHRFINDSNFMFAHTTSHAALKIKTPKEKTFEDFAEERVKKGWI
ncbi:MAG: hypothetical protein ACXABY_25730 [Candidatus Thorarchaeota archaeon]|jgi:hypothetical protein